MDPRLCYASPGVTSTPTPTRKGRPRRQLTLRLLALCGPLLAGACGGSAQEAETPVTVPARPFGPADAALFADDISPAVFGLPVEQPPSDDPRLSEVARRAGTVTRGRVSTVSRETLGRVERYVLTFVPDGPPLAGEALGGPVELRLPARSDTGRRLDARGARMTGTRLVVFASRFADGEEGEDEVLHFHAQPDTPEIAAVAARARALVELEEP